MAEHERGHLSAPTAETDRGGRPASAPHRDPAFAADIASYAHDVGVTSERGIADCGYRIIGLGPLVCAWDDGDRSFEGLWTPDRRPFRWGVLVELGRLRWATRGEDLDFDDELVLEHAREVSRRGLSDREAVRYLRDVRRARAADRTEPSERLARALGSTARAWMQTAGIDPASSQARTLLVLALRRVRTEGPR